MSLSKVPSAPLSRIALCCSGGGYRAAAFHLGAMSYLNEVSMDDQSLLQRVVGLSTVSGGTITGVIYALQRNKGKSFTEIYHALLQQLKSIDLVRLGLEKLSDEGTWKNSRKRRNLINAFAEIYDEHFTQGETFDVFDNMVHSHLEEVMFNATEFSKGLIFRFQSDGRFGNYYFPVKKDIAGEIKLSDIIAASSCFTGGFEPIEWPADFVHEESVNLMEEIPLMAKVGLMDGGIYDNQGVDSILLAESRADAKPYDLIIISDVTSPYFHPFEFTEPKIKGKWHDWNYRQISSLIRKRVRQIIWGLFIMWSLSIIYLGANWSTNSTLTGVVVSILFLTTVLLGSVIWGRKKLVAVKSRVLNYLERELADDLPVRDLGSLKFSEIPVHKIEPLLLDRIKSLAILVSTIFLKTVRRLVYGRLYDSDRHRFKRASTLIHQLTQEDYNSQLSINSNNPAFYQNLAGCHSDLKGNYEKVIGVNLQKIAENAVRFGTTLWFLEEDVVEDRLNSLLICGQASMCFTLLRYLTELRCTPGNGYDALSPSLKKTMEHIWVHCMKDWARFKEDPRFLNNKLQQ